MALAGYYIDLEEEFCLIEKDFHITTKQYKFKESPDKNHPELFYLNETLINLEIDVKGTLTKNFEQKRDGYFEGDWSDYKYIKWVRMKERTSYKAAVIMGNQRLNYGAV